MEQKIAKPIYSTPHNERLWLYVSGSTASSEDDKNRRNLIYPFQENEQILNLGYPSQENEQIPNIRYYRNRDIIYNFRDLKYDWDSYKAELISPIAITLALQVLYELNKNYLFFSNININVFPMRDGGVQFEFDGEDICAELEIDKNGILTFLKFDDEGNILDKQPIFELPDISLHLEAFYA